MIRWFAHYLKKYKLTLALAVLFAALSGALLLVGPLFLGRAVDALTAQNGVKWEELTKNLVLLASFGRKDRRPHGHGHPPCHFPPYS